MMDRLRLTDGMASHESGRLRDRAGFVLPVVVFGLLIMSVMAVAAMLTAGDENQAARAMRESSLAFYAAEAGLHAVYANWNNIEEIDSLKPGESLTLDWQGLSSGASYRATIYRFDDGGQTMYQLEVRGRGLGARAGQRTLSLALTAGPGGPGEAYMLGQCCETAVTVRGRVDMEDETGIDGHDINPFGWAAADVCQDSLYDKPGLMMEDTSQIRFNDPTAWVDGEPPIVENPDLSDASWDSLGDLGWADLKNMADKSFHDGEFEPRPSVTIDPLTGEVVCNTADPMNLGSPDPNHPCFNYFPIVTISDDVTFRYGYAQGIFVLDWDEGTKAGS
ncbi:MAG TPA: pilus assembly PilX N-terminal domain-containing protein, partial [Gemmatimonadota bacterium]|nr:pilus assembly PilX N-terminal domain-containing protein [Gemmatimonadota bacterium]